MSKQKRAYRNMKDVELPPDFQPDHAWYVDVAYVETPASHCFIAVCVEWDVEISTGGGMARYFIRKAEGRKSIPGVARDDVVLKSNWNLSTDASATAVALCDASVSPAKAVVNYAGMVLKDRLTKGFTCETTTSVPGAFFREWFASSARIQLVQRHHVPAWWPSADSYDEDEPVTAWPFGNDGQKKRFKRGERVERPDDATELDELIQRARVNAKNRAQEKANAFDPAKFKRVGRFKLFR